MRAVYPFNDNWLFWADEVGNNLHDDAFERVTLPHTNKIFPHHNFDSSEYAFISTYRKRFRLPEPVGARRVFLDFDGAMIAARVIINGHEFPEQRGGYVPFSFDITDYVQEGAENLLVVYLDSRERPDIPPYGYVVDYLTFGGIYRDVWLRYVEPLHIKDVFVRTVDVLSETPKAVVDVWIRNDSQNAQKAVLGCGFEYEIDKDWLSADVAIEVAPNSTSLFSLSLSGAAKDVALWTLEHPRLYEMAVGLSPLGDGHPDFDDVAVRFGFREAFFSKDNGKFYLNGQPLKLRGLNRHQTYPYIGAAASKRLQRKDADILKFELGCNIVRTSHYPQSPHFLERCDEIGLLVFEEIPGWQFIGDDDWKSLALRDVRAMIERDRNHPSIIMWGVRINESPDDSALYEETNSLAHELDPSRQTGGVRNFQQSQFLEDVFTYNDFSNSIREPVHLPQLVTEFNGHMYPTKTWDQEERLIEHALRHARIQDKSHGMDNLAGAIGWCAFDYNTHYHLGSGDRMCYHGVMDIFRLPKYAAYFYASQQDPSQRIILQAATTWTMGDRDTGGLDPLVVFSNCEEVDLWVGDLLYGRFKPDKKQFPHLPYAPFVIPGLEMRTIWGALFQDLRIIGYIGGKQVAEQQIEASAIPNRLVVEVDDSELAADGQDMTRVVFKITDKYGNRLPFTNQVVTFELHGTGANEQPLADLIGENPFALMGGQAALYLRARNQSGVVTIRAATPRVEPAVVSVTLKPT